MQEQGGRRALVRDTKDRRHRFAAGFDRDSLGPHELRTGQVPCPLNKRRVGSSQGGRCIETSRRTLDTPPSRMLMLASRRRLMCSAVVLVLIGGCQSGDAATSGLTDVAS